MPLTAFVTAVPTVSSRGSGLLGISGTRATRRGAIVSKYRVSAMPVMTADTSITLQTLLYTPNPGVSSVEDKDLMCRLIYKQVFGNAYLMDSERDELYKAESKFRCGAITVRDFVRACALSETYRRRFFSCCGPYRAVELNCKHLLGRGPVSKAEVSEHVQRTIQEGYEADINSYIDSEEYERSFGEDFVPGMTFKGTYSSPEEFNRMCAIYSAEGTADKSLRTRARNQGTSNPNHVLSLDGAGTPSKLVSLASSQNVPTSVLRVKQGIPARPDLESRQDSSASVIMPTKRVVNDKASPKFRYEIAMGNCLYLTQDEIAAYRTDRYGFSQEKKLIEKEVTEAMDQIARLQEKINRLSSAI